MRSLSAIIAILLGTSASLFAQSSSRFYALVNARIETVTKGVIERGTLVMRDGRITALGADVSAPSGAEVIDCSGLTVYPGLIDAGTQLGLVEIGSIQETHDEDEEGDLTPEAQALTAVNPNSVAIPVTRVNGVTTVITAPSGGLLPGTAALINLFGYTPEQMSVAGTRAMVVNFPSRARNGWWDQRPDDEIEKSWKEGLDKLNEVWDRAELYARIDSSWKSGKKGDRLPEYAPQIEALLPAVRRQAVVMVEVNKGADIDTAIAWIKRRHIRAVLTGVADGWRVADHIAASGIPCIVGPAISMPTNDADRYDRAYATPGLLHAAGVELALRTGEASNVRNLPFNAGFAAAYGMGRDAALRSVTIVPAHIFGVDSLLGSLEVGKQATLFTADGDPFEPATHVRGLFINGWKVPLTSRHTELYQEFVKREP